MKILLVADQVRDNRDHWAKLRRAGITASEIPSIMRVDGCYSSPLAVYWNKVIGDEIPDTDEMALGRYLEPYIAGRFRRLRPELSVVDGPLIAHGRYRWQMATPDLLAWRGEPGDTPELVVELKTTGTWIGWGDEPDGAVPPAYLAQVLWSCAVSGARGGWLVAMNRATGKIRCYWIGLDADARHDIDLMRGEGAAFRDRVKRLDPPEPDWRPATTAALKRVWAATVPEAVTTSNGLRRRVHAAKRNLIAAKHRFGAAENALRAQMRTATVALDAEGEEFASRAVFPHTYLSAALVRERYPEVAAECTVTSDKPTDRLFIKGWDD